MLEGTGYRDAGRQSRILKVKNHFAKVRPRYAEFLSEYHWRRYGNLQKPDPGRHDLQHGEPAKQQGAGDRVKEVLEEVPRVRKDAGYPPLVTPSSQIVGTQAVFNVLMGRYKVMTGEFADLMLGYYGATIGMKNPEVHRKGGSAAEKKPSPAVRPTC